MATLTDQMQHLTENLANVRRERVAFVGRLAPDVGALRRELRQFLSDFRTRFDAESRATREERQAFVTGLCEHLAQFLGDFRTRFEQAAQAGRAERAEFLSDIDAFVANVQQSANQLLGAFRSDLAAVRKDIAGASQSWKKFVSGVGNGQAKGRRPK